MEWLIIIFIMLFVLAPVMWLKPSPRQKRTMAMRQHVIHKGVTVKEEKPPLHQFRGTMPAYRWHYPKQQPGPDFVLVRDQYASKALEPYYAGWRWRIAPLRPIPASAVEPLNALLERLPLDALVLESTPNSLTLWWWESQNAARFDTYLADFNQLRDQLSGQADRLPQEPPLSGSRTL
ncbi:preprotein translocase subunit YajC [Vreelandella arcis]|uniref:Preprotein translocase subunit YajC n=1 Tax=Vreelandella arcis TaxID=416873 RepID=A0A1H0GNG4_9GAMM|nr:preprotein translocase subunit YajC [Halomonas arcis]SDO08444.1 hypothetical protein SAMN04487951_112107 [Halomonas arcis]